MSSAYSTLQSRSFTIMPSFPIAQETLLDGRLLRLHMKGQTSNLHKEQLHGINFGHSLYKFLFDVAGESNHRAAPVPQDHSTGLSINQPAKTLNAFMTNSDNFHGLNAAVKYFATPDSFLKPFLPLLCPCRGKTMRVTATRRLEEACWPWAIGRIPAVH